MAWSGSQSGLRLQQDFPQVSKMVRFIDGGSGYVIEALLSYQDGQSGEIKQFKEDHFIYADSVFFQFFTFPLIAGDPIEVLDEPAEVVLTASAARKYFGDEPAIGKAPLLFKQQTLKVSGVAADVPEHSHLRLDFVASYATYYARQGITGEIISFWCPPSHTYVKLHENANAASLQSQLPLFSQKHRDADDAARMPLYLQSLQDIWLGKDYQGQQQYGGSLAHIYMFCAIALFILLLAFINFVNLSAAKGDRRAREFGIR